VEGWGERSGIGIADREARSIGAEAALWGKDIERHEIIGFRGKRM